MRTMLGGVSGMPRACRRNDNVTMMRVNDVIAISASGTKLSSDMPTSSRR